MPDERHVSEEEIRRWTREFLQTDFWKLVLKPRLESERRRVTEMKRRSAVKGELNLPYGWEFYLMAMDDFELSWLEEWKGADVPEKEPELTPPEYVSPRYPMANSEKVPT